jgi:hypothetical protein
MPGDPEKIYTDGYAAFDRGDFAVAIKSAGKCLLAAPIDSYWFPGALGLRCWAANFADDRECVERDAHALLAIDTGDEKMWFDGLAAFNLALIRRRLGDVGEAELLFDQARAKYTAYRINPKKPDEWRLVRELFEAISHWAACGEADKVDDMAGRLSVLPDPSGETVHIHKAVDLYQRFVRGEDVADEAHRAADDGVSRTFLALILIR